MPVFSLFFLPLALLLAVFSSTSLHADAIRDKDAQATLIVYNKRDILSESTARLYALQRDIPQDQIFALDCPTDEEISRSTYLESIELPLRRKFQEAGWWKIASGPNGTLVAKENKIRFMVLMSGIPLKIAPPPPPQLPPNPDGSAQHPPPTPPMKRTEASVDSELAIFGITGAPIEGPVHNPYYKSFRSIHEADVPVLILVCRLDSPDPEITTRMILDPLEVEKEGLYGAVYIDSRRIHSGGYVAGDNWLRAAAENARQAGMPVIFDSAPATLPPHFPMRDAAIYLGWYSEHANGPFLNPDFQFKKGAVAVHIHSFSAHTLKTKEHRWVGPLLSKGASATLGNVYEPYLELTPHLDIFFNRLASGMTVAEAAYASMKGLSWMTVVLSDPLYRPFAVQNDLANLSPPTPENKKWADFRSSAIQRLSQKEEASQKIISLAQQYQEPLFLEALASSFHAESNSEATANTLQQALELASSQEDKIRIILTHTRNLQFAQGVPAALEYLRPQLSKFPNSPSLQALNLELDPPPPPSPSPSPSN